MTAEAMRAAAVGVCRREIERAESRPSGNGSGSATVCLHEIAALPLPDGWQPIATAPRDGAEVLAWGDSDYREPRHLLTCWNGRAWVYVDEDHDVVECRPTHWQPLPAAPGAENNGKLRDGTENA